MRPSHILTICIAVAILLIWLVLRYSAGYIEPVPTKPATYKPDSLKLKMRDIE